MIQKTGREVTLRNETGVELKRNTAFVKKYNEQDDVSRGNGNEHQEVQAESMVQAEDSGPSRIPEETKVVSENSRVQPGRSEKGEDRAERFVRRSSRTVKQPAHFKDLHCFGCSGLCSLRELVCCLVKLKFKDFVLDI